MFLPVILGGACHPERSEGSDSEAVVLSEAKDLFERESFSSLRSSE